MTELQISDWRGAHTDMGRFVGDRVSRLQARILARGDGPTKATLAKLRRRVGQPLAADLELWGLVFDGFPESELGRGDLPSPAEEAAYAAMTLFAVHQQSKFEPMHVSGVGLGAAVRGLASPDGAEGESHPPPHRFTALATADTFADTLHHARGLVQQLRAASIGVDYGRLAEDLAALQDLDRADSVRLSWAREFHRGRRAAAVEPSDPSAAAVEN